MILALWLAAAGTVAHADTWSDTVDQISSGVVSVTIDRVRPFDTTFYANSQATAFVVDAERGILLTNRHVVSPGPVVAEALFQDGEEIPLVPLYRDPVHDFGFFGFDPEALQYLDPTELVLFPEGARVGTEIRVLGNDAGEKLSILTGTLARLDRPAPNYGLGKFNDFNTFYLQAASATSGGSSGSPVVDEQGRVVGLNAGSNKGSASSFYLPLDRVVRALEFVRRGEEPPRGTLLTTFAHKRFDELARLGLASEVQREVREEFPSATGMLVVDSMVPLSDAFTKLKVGDIVRTIEGKPVDGFVALERVLDDAVGDMVTLGIDREGESLQISLPVTNLHEVTPDSYVEVGGSIVHDLSYQVARTYHQPLVGVYLADDGYMFDRGGVPFRAVIYALDDQPTRNIGDFERVLATLPDGKSVRVKYKVLNEPTRSKTTVVQVDRRWFPTRRCERAQGPWPCDAIEGPPSRVTREGGSTTFTDEVDKKAAMVLQSLVSIEFDVPYTVDGTRGNSFTGQGLVVDAEQGLVVTDRNTVPVSLGDAVITVARSVRIEAEVVAIHPTHGLALLRYDPAKLGDTPLRSAVFDTQAPEIGDDIRFIGRARDDKPVVRDTTVTEYTVVALPIPSRPRFRETNLEVMELASRPDSGDNGLLVDKKGRILGMWGSFGYDSGRDLRQAHAGIPSWLIVDFVEAYRKSPPGMFRGLELELGYMSLPDARELGLPDPWIRRLSEHDNNRRVLKIIRRTEDAPSTEILLDGDLLLQVGEQVVTTFREVEELGRNSKVSITYFREGEVREAQVETRVLRGDGIDRVIIWAGAFLQSTPVAAQQQRRIPNQGVYVDLRFRGSPSMRYSLARNTRIVEANGEATPNLDAFMRVVGDLEDRDAVRLVTIDLQGRTKVVTLKLDKLAFPTRELLRTEDGWVRRELR